MKYAQHTGSSRPAPALKSLLSGLAVAACLGFAINAHAQPCTISNWDAAANLTDANTGTQGSDNKRYGGPCGLRVPLNGTPAFLTDDSPTASGEVSYIARFYAFLDSAGTDPVILFAADDGAEDQIQIWYNFPDVGDLNLRVFDSGGTESDLPVTAANVGSGWKAIEFVWQASNAADNVTFSVSDRFGNAEGSASVDTTGVVVSRAHLGNLNGASGGQIDFDDFDSRRQTRPGRLMRADANDDGQINALDFIAVINEIGGTVAAGQPDCNEDGVINALDFICVINVIGGN